MEEVAAGKGTAADLEYLQELGQTVKAASRCGLGQTSPHPILTTMQNFQHLYEQRINKQHNGLKPTFDPVAAVREAARIAGRESVHFH